LQQSIFRSGNGGFRLTSIEVHLECLEIDEHDRPVLLYDNHKTAWFGRRLPLADAALVGAIRAQQAWVTERFPDTRTPDMVKSFT
jgi:hypothetical protein